MTEWLGAAFLVVGLLLLLRQFGLVDKSREVIRVARRSFEVIRDPELDDESKEKTLQANSVQLLRFAFVLTLGGAVALFAPLGVLWLMDKPGWISLDGVFTVALSPLFLLLSCLLAVAAFRMPRRRDDEKGDYSRLDRGLHRLAFRTRVAQIGMADLEDRMMARALESCRTDRPVFITALPRAGTTLLLECCAGLPEFASHCYRDMPFVLVPCLWARFSSSFQRGGERRERAHGDGMLIDYDSPEALEETLWATFWKDRYREDRILPWGTARNAEFKAFFDQHLRKIIALRSCGDGRGTRYMSKNNLNIARTHILRALYPNADIVVPFRDPLQHAASLLTQHRNFLRIHEEDAFACEYMRAIGHFDFGENLLPVDFDGWLDPAEERDPLSLGFWIAYWVAAYRYLLGREEDRLVFVSHARLCEDPAGGLHRLGEAIACEDLDALVATADRVHTPRRREVDTGSVNPDLLEEAAALYSVLGERGL